MLWFSHWCVILIVVWYFVTGSSIKIPLMGWTFEFRCGITFCMLPLGECVCVFELKSKILWWVKVYPALFITAGIQFQACCILSQLQILFCCRVCTILDRLRLTIDLDQQMIQISFYSGESEEHGWITCIWIETYIHSDLYTQWQDCLQQGLPSTVLTVWKFWEAFPRM